ncbi:hypothetical protein CXG81DRAFT_18223 [Caulochytrium protostelioides]|uniref:C2H2-type domain-containing protein n=1 Tax=Caulochytrium protostelioides TaxID=1555241 RepID=A0A4P9X9P7_9FUNG|nr:hypothetical protein CXG81DRAFT_18223 [Caulochytrium protostelioides]|eukprot:RKP02048.1 hypothetical protein CXG81DRAFT_18223 [Caulochytrium protostelioides]
MPPPTPPPAPGSGAPAVKDDTAFRRTRTAGAEPAPEDQFASARLERERQARLAAARAEFARGAGVAPDADAAAAGGPAEQYRYVGKRREALDLNRLAGTTQLVDAGAAASAASASVLAGPGARVPGSKKSLPGFYCDVCDRNFKDSMNWLDHINSPRHLSALGKDTKVERASYEDVKRRLDRLAQTLAANRPPTRPSLAERVARAQAAEAYAARRKKERKKQSIQRKALAATASLDHPADGANDIAAMMGFGGFGSTKH